MEAFKSFINVEFKYAITIFNTVSHIYNILMQRLPLEESSVSQSSKMGMLELKLQSFVWTKCLLTAVDVAHPTRIPPLFLAPQEEEDSHLYVIGI